MYALLSQRLRELVGERPRDLVLKTSCLERHSAGLFAVRSSDISQDNAQKDKDQVKDKDRDRDRDRDKEPGSDGGIAKARGNGGRVGATRVRHCATEVCHAHPSDGSLHLVLHPADKS